jgi:hypothetical protein
LFTADRTLSADIHFRPGALRQRSRVHSRHTRERTRPRHEVASRQRTV